MTTATKLWTPNAVEPAGSTIKGLVLICAQCQKNFPVGGIRDGLCLRCTSTRGCKAYRDELVRLYKKREKLLKVGAGTKSNDEQAQRVRLRILKYVTALTVDQKLVNEIVNEQGQMAREQALSNSRIRLPAFGRR
jgi:hypothetical protein